MSDKRNDAPEPKEDEPHKVDEKVQEKAGEERERTGGYE